MLDSHRKKFIPTWLKIQKKWGNSCGLKSAVMYVFQVHNLDSPCLIVMKLISNTAASKSQDNCENYVIQ